MKSSLPMAAPATARRTPVEPFRGQSRSRLFRADLLTVLAWASVALAVALWLADGGAAGFSTLAGSFTALGVVAGLAGMDLVLLMLLLAARIPVIDGAVGHDRALEFHRQLGKPSLYLLLAHGILIAVGDGMAEGLDPVSELVALWVLVPDMWLAIVSIGLFIAVVAERGNHIWRAGADRPGPGSDPSISARCRWPPRTFSPRMCSRRRSSPAGGGC